MGSMGRAATYFRNFIFGVEDSLVSTVGLLSGIAIADVGRETILLTGVVLIFVEAFSMAAGSFLSEASAEEYVARADTQKKLSYTAGIIMFFSYFIAGFIPLFPYIIFPATSALFYSVAFSLLALFVLGAIGGHVSETGILKRGIRMAIVGGIAILVGVCAGVLVT
jgi:VIT1/CCC1 family predicted Fe2+/Mn2+ transporter